MLAQSHYNCVVILRLEETVPETKLLALAPHEAVVNIIFNEIAEYMTMLILSYFQQVVMVEKARDLKRSKAFAMSLYKICLYDHLLVCIDLGTKLLLNQVVNALSVKKQIGQLLLKKLHETVVLCILGEGSHVRQFNHGNAAIDESRKGDKDEADSASKIQMVLNNHLNAEEDHEKKEIVRVDVTPDPVKGPLFNF